MLDANQRTLVVIDSDGEHVGTANLQELFGLRYPWFQDLEWTPDGLLVMATDERQAEDGSRTGVYESLLFRVSGF